MIWEIEDGRKVVEGLDETGRPDPEYAAALGLRPAPAGRRALASLIEFAVWALLQLPYWLVALPTLVKVATGALQPWGLASHPNLVWMIVATAISSVLTLAFVIVQLVLHGRRGVTLGKAFVGIRSVDVKTLERPGIGRSVLRGLVLWASFLLPVIGPALFLASPLLDGEKRGRGWLDKAAGTWFVDVREGLDPYHEKKMRIARKTVAAEPEAERSQLPSLATPADSAGLAYRPGARTSSGVVGAARPQAPGEQRPIGLATQQPAEPAPAHTVPGMPSGGARLGGYRPGELSGVPRAGRPDAQAPSAPAPGLPGGIVDSVPGRDRSASAPAAAPAPGWQQPAAPQAPAQPAAWQAPAPAAQQASPIADETVIEVEHEAPQPSHPAAAAPQTAPQAAPDAPSAPAAPLPPAPSAADEIDDRTVRRIEVVEDDDDLEATRARTAARAAAATLAFDSGERFAITGAALIGRNPSPSPGEVVDHLLPIADDTRSVSKTHLLIAVRPLAAVDRASTNGSSVVRSGAEHPLEPGRPFPLAAGDVVRFGDRSVVIEGA
ncbi:RDD family protein [Agrococcus terreus]|uniref:RDD family protein n=1 Tax=Agrococcus terreus TaxID=574649 RepID=UPI00384BF9D0